MLEVTSRDVGEVKVLEFEGNLDTNTSPDAQERLDGLVSGGSTKILINFGKLNYLSSAGLRVLLATAKRLRASSGDLRLCGLNESVDEVFEISGFSSILSVHGSESEALEGF